MSGSFFLPWFSERSQRARRPTQALELAGAKLGRGKYLFLGPGVPLERARGRSLRGRKDQAQREAPQPAPPSLQQTPVQYLLPEAKAQDSDKICVVIDLDETLVHSSFKVGPAQQPSARVSGGVPHPGLGGRCVLDPMPWGSSSNSSSSFPPTASEQRGLHHPCGD